MKTIKHYLLAAALLASTASAQDNENAFWLGLGLKYDAAFPGAKDTRLLPFPLINWRQDHFFARSSKGLEEAGIQWQAGEHIAVGTQLAFELGRDSADSRLLQQLKMPDIAYGVSAGAHIEYSTHIGPAPVDALLRLRQRSGPQRGALADLRVEVGVYGNQTIGIQTYIQSTWANRQAMDADFGIKAYNASFAAISPYSADAGLRNYLVGIAGKIDLDADWMAIGAIEYSTLSNDASDSPITEQKNAQAITLGLMYKF